MAMHIKTYVVAGATALTLSAAIGYAQNGHDHATTPPAQAAAWIIRR